MPIQTTLKEKFDQRSVIKLISGINNFDAKSVGSMIQIAEKGNATYVDIAASTELVHLALSLTRLPICVSSVSPISLLECVRAGAELVELGNFDSFYNQGYKLSFADVVNLSMKVRDLIPEIPLCVTIPYLFPLKAQIKLAEKLEDLGVDILQTEGLVTHLRSNKAKYTLIEKAIPTVATTHVLSKFVSVPILCSSGISDVTIPLAVKAGASGVGICSCIKELNSDVAMLATLNKLVSSIDSCSYSLV
uniref:Uncharacterized protein ycf23 n=1 Tax=Glaucocystis incrassata TaxID=1789788 RepID=A0A3G1IVA8_9EUKA|nr:hypothetical protein Ycf23 [Glaucocystis incrassata]ASQ39978.1 hypothetical protein Ycf23 [Glaucocystis incrassata]